MVPAASGVDLVVLILSILGLWIGARILVEAAVGLARRFGLSELVIGLTIVAVGTSTPELAVTADAAFKGLGDIAVANVLGSNAYNLAAILGVLALVTAIPVGRSLVYRDGVALLAATALGIVLVADLQVSRVDGLALTGAFSAYILYLLRAERSEGPSHGNRTSGSRTSGNSAPDSSTSGGSTPGDGAYDEPTPADAVETAAVPEGVRNRLRDPLLLVGGLVVVVVSGDALVAAASSLARQAGIAEWVIGGTIVAAGTSTPEFAVSLVALRRASLGITVGNVVGSNVVNITAILGVGGLVRPMQLTASPGFMSAWLGVLTILVVVALWSGGVLSRLEGGLLTVSEIVRWALGLIGFGA